MKTVEETRRQLFEAWFESLNHYTPMKNIYGNLWGYSEPKVQDAWDVWNAALDAIVIELPEELESKGFMCPENAFNQGIRFTEKSINSLNLGIKVK